MNRAVALLTTGLILASAGGVRAATFDQVAKPGANYDKAEFRLWLPEGAGPVRALVVLVPGSNGEGRTMVDDPFWQAFAVKHRLGLVGCHLTDKPHDQSFIEEYVDVAKGSGQALLDSIATLGAMAGHAEMATAPLMLWGMSAGGEFDYEFAVWKPERVIAFVVNKGNIYYTALAPAATRSIPALLFTGEQDLDFRIETVNGIFAVNRPKSSARCSSRTCSTRASLRRPEGRFGRSPRNPASSRTSRRRRTRRWGTPAPRTA
jgi:poly(3-hydroxybutyrate) depolymerase